MKVSATRIGSDELGIELRGEIDETSQPGLRDLLSKIDTEKVSFNLEQVELVNSLGARYWIEFIRDLEKKTGSIKLRNCSIAFIECCNIYPKFAPKNTIESLYVPIDCPKCGNDGVVLCAAAQLVNDGKLPESRCVNCSSMVEPQVPLDEYLQCLS